MNFENYLFEQINKHPSVQPQDIVKLCYQAAYGAEHLLSNLDMAREYLEKEYNATDAKDIALYELISDSVCRVNIAAWKANRLPIHWLFRMFVTSACMKNTSDNLFLNYLQIAQKVLMQANIRFSIEDWKTYLHQYKKAGMPTVHHSSQYRKYEEPAYRIVNRQYIRLLPILEKISRECVRDKVCVIAIDGRAASGKSTIAKQLKIILGADVIQMDDFFLPIDLRTQERFNTPGGNIHYERFIEEILPYISLKKSFSYRIFDCSKMDYNGEVVIASQKFRIVEGSYSCHPLFGKYADITVFSDVDADEQICRIRHRNGDVMVGIFRDKWIPLEERYFERYLIPQNADVYI